MLRSELNELFSKFKDVHKQLSDFAAGSSDENFDLLQTRNEFGALKLQLLENSSRLTKESEYLEKAKTILVTPRFKLQRIRTLSESRLQPLLLDSSSSSSRDLSFVSTSNPANSSVMDDSKETEKSDASATATSGSDECVRRIRLLEIKLEMEEEMDEFEEQRWNLEKKKREKRRALLRKAVAEGFAESVIDDLSKDAVPDKLTSNPDPSTPPLPPVSSSLSSDVTSPPATTAASILTTASVTVPSTTSTPHPTVDAAGTAKSELVQLLGSQRLHRSAPDEANRIAHAFILHFLCFPHCH